MDMQLCCPECHCNLICNSNVLTCIPCGNKYNIIDGIPHFTDYREDINIQQWNEMHNSTVIVKLYNNLKNIISSEYHKVDHISNFINNIEEGACVVELGSGNRKLIESIINVDLFPFPNVNIVADISKTPFSSESVDYIVIDTVLEHVPEPHAVVAEIFRVLKPGGKVICIAPFIFPYHGYPKNYFNFSEDALQFLFKKFSRCEISFDMGPTSAMTNLISEYFSLAFSKSTTSYVVLKGLFLFPLFWLKFLDSIWSSKGNAVRISGTLCAHVIK